jgi:hypothetical protein
LLKKPTKYDHSLCVDVCGLSRHCSRQYLHFGGVGNIPGFASGSHIVIPSSVFFPSLSASLL